MEQTFIKGLKKKTIKQILKKKFNQFVESIKDPTVKELVQKNTIITGGCIASMLLGEKVNDFDLYFTNFETTKAVADYYVNRFRVEKAAGIGCNIYVQVEEGAQIPVIEQEPDISGIMMQRTVFQKEPDRVRIVVKSSGVASAEGTEVGYQYFESRPDDEANDYVSGIFSDAGSVEEAYEEIGDLAQETVSEGKPEYKPVFLSTNAITLSDRVQLVLRFYGDAKTIHDNYDFVHCTNYWESKTGELVLKQDALEALLSRELRYVGSKYPLCSIIRLRKFIKRGWTVNAGQILKMVMQLNELDLTDPAVLTDQLTGVDSAYFVQLMDRIKEKDPDKVNAAYLCEIVDRIF